MSAADLALLRRRDLGDHVGVPGAVAERGAGLLEQLVRDAGLRAGAGLEHDLVALLDELAHDVGHERDAALALGGLLGDSDLHEGGNLYERAPIWRQTRPEPAVWRIQYRQSAYLRAASHVAARHGGERTGAERAGPR